MYGEVVTSTNTMLEKYEDPLNCWKLESNEYQEPEAHA